MNNALLIYRIQSNNTFKDLKLEHNSLYLIDKITSGFIDEKDFISHYYNKDKIYDFEKSNGNIKGSLIIDYRKNIEEKKELKPLYNIKDKIVINEDFYNNKITEIEKARKLLFNSKNQAFTKILLNSHLLDYELNRLIDLDDEEASYAFNNKLDVKLINNKYYTSFKSLLIHRINSNKLGILRNAYQDMLDVLKNRINEKDGSTFYYYNRELRLLINKYQDMICIMTVKNLKVHSLFLNKNKQNNKKLVIKNNFI